MSNFTEFLIDSRAIEAIYGDELPTLENIEINEIKFIPLESTNIIFSLDLNSFPQKPPTKWCKHNTVQIFLEALDVKNLKMYMTQKPSLHSTIKIVKILNSLHIHLVNEKVDLSFEADFLALQKISAYTNEDKVGG